MSSIAGQLHESAWPRTFAMAVAYIAGYVLLDWLSYVQPELKLGITPWNPQAGLTMAMLIVCGASRAWLTLLAVVLAEIMIRGQQAGWSVLLLGAALIAAVYACGAHVLRRHELAESIEFPRHVVWLLVVGAIVTLCVACGYALLFRPTSGVPIERIIGRIARYFVGDFNGILTVTPVLLSAPRWREGLRAIAARRVEVAGLAVLIGVLLWGIFGDHNTEDMRFFYPLFVPVIWVALRWGVPGTALCILILQFSLMLTVEDDLIYTPPLLDLQLLMVTLGTTGLLLGAVAADRAVALRRVAEREGEQRAIMAMAPDAIVTTDTNLRIVSANAAAADMFGMSEKQLAGQPLSARLESIELDSSQGRASPRGVRGDGSTFPTDLAWANRDTASAQGYILVVRDITERLASEAQAREREEALARAMRFAVAGELASAVTHELNQPITALVSYLRAAQILADPLHDQDKRLGITLDKAANEAIRTSDVLRRLRDFYRGSEPQREIIEIPQLIASVVRSHDERLTQTQSRLHTDFAADLPPVNCDGTQIEMILHNLLGNALDAIAATGRADHEIAVTATHDVRTVSIAIEDTGPGPTPEIAAQLFEPFVTSKPAGMGLGLAISRSLIRAQGGDLWAEPGGSLGGARFVLCIPTTATTQSNL
ncbi:ATP-binding protein [Steroidobacter cummioxidans]|uniref:ATP-binding protein n=1 Tax=Steroidobacter cummioxidans TaxID=1803913 RepID=UPI000E31AC6A|nr:ATP-binding protein [Steroidobacter cummioxidans]